mmetsp:Transcript_2217/g.3212  ORF Transcript_2217/g.3212 Transcript_2217/m.3212 type:complete len:227 (-) Transcript_2217:2755-3435(-)
MKLLSKDIPINIESSYLDQYLFGTDGNTEFTKQYMKPFKEKEIGTFNPPLSRIDFNCYKFERTIQYCIPIENIFSRRIQKQFQSKVFHIKMIEKWNRPLFGAYLECHRDYTVKELGTDFSMTLHQYVQNEEKPTINLRFTGRLPEADSDYTHAVLSEILEKISTITQQQPQQPQQPQLKKDLINHLSIYREQIIQELKEYLTKECTRWHTLLINCIQKDDEKMEQS